MATSPNQFQPKSPQHSGAQSGAKVFTLEGKAYACYRAGQNHGAREAYTHSSANLREYQTHLTREFTSLQQALLEHENAMSKELRAAVHALPTLPNGLELIAKQFDSESSRRQTECNQQMAEVAAQDTASESAESARWRPPLRAWGYLALMTTTASTIATLVASYATRVGW